MKICKVCGELKPLDDFYASPGMRDGHRNDCKPCNAAAHARRYRLDPEKDKDRVRRWREENPEKYAAMKHRWRNSDAKKSSDRRSYLKRKYGITPEDYDRMLEAQGGVCGICGRPPREDISLHVDHIHGTNDIRGLLCFPCNNALGDFEDDSELLRRARDYVVDADAARARRRLLALKASA